LRDGCDDFRTGETIEVQDFFSDQIDIHHIFPEQWCKNNTVQAQVYNSVINKTPISASTNRKIGGKAPSEYLRILESDAGIEPTRMESILRSHRIEPQHVRSDDFWAFFAARAEQLLDQIDAVMKKKTQRESGIFTIGAPMEQYDDGPIEWEDVAALPAVAD
jgi:hypothetical protein